MEAFWAYFSEDSIFLGCRSSDRIVRRAMKALKFSSISFPRFIGCLVSMMLAGLTSRGIGLATRCFLENIWGM